MHFDTFRFDFVSFPVDFSSLHVALASTIFAFDWIIYSVSGARGDDPCPKTGTQRARALNENSSNYKIIHFLFKYRRNRDRARRRKKCAHHEIGRGTFNFHSKRSHGGHKSFSHNFIHFPFHMSACHGTWRMGMMNLNTSFLMPVATRWIMNEYAITDKQFWTVFKSSIKWRERESEKKKSHSHTVCVAFRIGISIFIRCAPHTNGPFIWIWNSNEFERYIHTALSSSYSGVWQISSLHTDAR